MASTNSALQRVPNTPTDQPKRAGLIGRLINGLRARQLSLRKPRRTIDDRSMNWIVAQVAGVAAALVWMLVYFLTLPLVPPISIHGGNFNLAHFAGSLFGFTVGAPHTLVAGAAILFVVFVGLAISYAVVLAWGEQVSSVPKGLGFGLAAFVAIGFLLWLAPGYDPVMMRNAIPDPGFFLLGWTGWATLQLLLCFLAFGLTLGILYRRAAIR